MIERRSLSSITYIAAMFGAAFQIKAEFTLQLQLILISLKLVRHRPIRQVQIFIYQALDIEWYLRGSLLWPFIFLLLSACRDYGGRLSWRGDGLCYWNHLFCGSCYSGLSWLLSFCRFDRVCYLLSFDWSLFCRR